MAGNKRHFSDRTLKALAPAKRGQRYEIWDTLPGFGVRVNDEVDKHRPGKAARVTFIYYSRFPGSPSPTRRVLGHYGNPSMTLAEARQKVADWEALIKKGVDPAFEEERKKRENQRLQENTFGAVAETFIERKVIGRDPERPLQRNGVEVARKLRTVFAPLWGDRPITAITADEAKHVIEGVRDYGSEKMLAAHGIKAGKRNGTKRKGGAAPIQARNLLALLKSMFRWAIGEGTTYGLQSSPVGHLSAKGIIGEQTSRDRILSDAELAAFWNVTGRMPYPYGPLYRLLLLTGLRLNEAADAAWPEFDLAGLLWTIPAARMKGKNSTARPHVVPLTRDMMGILDALPRFNGGDYLFSANFSAGPVWLNSKIKKRLDAMMLEELREAARKRGDDPDKVTLTPWRNHDLRRTLRSGLSRLRINSDIGEAILAHVKPGVAGVYDRYDLADEKRHALELWAARLRSITEPPPVNIIGFKVRR
jgi:integrase